jgi:hypothetical protein
MILLAMPGQVVSQVETDMKFCRELAFSTEEDFFAADTVISDGDLLGILGGECGICARNSDLLTAFDVQVDLGLDAADVIVTDAEPWPVAFSTELDSPNNIPTLIQFTAGDLLVTNGAVIPNRALTAYWKIWYDIGLDAVHFVGAPAQIQGFLDDASGIPRDDWLEIPGLLPGMLSERAIDIWYSTEGTWTGAEGSFLDGDLLSVLGGMVMSNDALLPPTVPAGIPIRGVDFGLDAATADREGTLQSDIHFSTEILFGGEPSFTDGDVLQATGGVVLKNYDLISCFGPRVTELGLDALSVNAPEAPGCVSRITKIGGVDIADIDPTDGMVILGTLGIAAPVPFGGKIDIQGTICDDVEEFRVVHRKAGTADPWQGMAVLPSANWQVKVDAFLPPYPDCLGTQNWASDLNGRYNMSNYRHLSEASLGGCNPGLSLTVWESAGDDLHEVVLETMTASDTYSDTVRLVQLDNSRPTVELEQLVGVCAPYSSDDMPLMVTGRISDTHFYRYQLRITGDGYGTYPYTPVAFYDSPTDSVIGTGTVAWDSYQPLHEVTVMDLAADPVPCGYTVWLRAWDRTLSCDFTYPANLATRCLGCRHEDDFWTFWWEPTP